jgi:hypothetical protein
MQHVLDSYFADERAKGHPDALSRVEYEAAARLPMSLATPAAKAFAQKFLADNDPLRHSWDGMTYRERATFMTDMDAYFPPGHDGNGTQISASDLPDTVRATLGWDAQQAADERLLDDDGRPGADRAWEAPTFWRITSTGGQLIGYAAHLVSQIPEMDGGRIIGYAPDGVKLVDYDHTEGT